MKGFLFKDMSGKWKVKYSELHSFAEGNIWTFYDLHPESSHILELENENIVELPLREDASVEFNIQTLGYDSASYMPITVAKLIFPDVDKFKKETGIKQYITNGGTLHRIRFIDIMRDGGTIVIRLGELYPPYYIHKNNKTLHNNYPTTDENMVTDEPTIIYIKDRLDDYLEKLERRVELTEKIIKDFKS